MRSVHVLQVSALAETKLSLLQDARFTAFLPERLTCIDGVLAFGQLVETGARP